MKQITIIFFVCVLAILVACQKENTLSPSGERDNWFAPDADADDTESVLRKKFYNEYNSYLLFSDTLYERRIGTSETGDPIYEYETLELNWNFTGTLSGTTWTLDYLEPSERADAAAYVGERFLKKIKGTRPYSVLPVNGITKTVDEGYGPEDEPMDYHFNHRCMVIDLSLRADDEDGYAQTLCVAWVKNLLKGSVYAKEMEAFRNLARNSAGELLYGKAKKDVFTDITGSCIGTNVPMEPFYEKGFLVNPKRSELLSADDDANAYVEEVVKQNDEAFEELYGDYPLVLSKYRIMKEIVNSILILE